MGFINDHVTDKVRVGRIDLLKNFSFFEVPEHESQKVVNTFKGLCVEDRKLIVEVAEESGGGKSDRSSFAKNERRPKRKGYQKRY